MRLNIEFRGKQAVITARKPRSKNGLATVSYPCGTQTQREKQINPNNLDRYEFKHRG